MKIGYCSCQYVVRYVHCVCVPSDFHVINLQFNSIGGMPNLQPVFIKFEKEDYLPV